MTEAWIQSAVIAVVISSLVTVMGWYISLRHERTREAERREERIWDYQTALLADIRSTANRFAHTNLDHYLDEVLALIERVPGYTPFLPAEPGSLLWGSIAQEVHILPTETIDAIVVFFSQLETIRSFVEDLRSDRYATLEQPRKAAMYRDYVRLIRHLLTLSTQAQEALHQALGLPPFSSLSPAPSGPKMASALEAEATGVVERSS